MQQLRIYFFLLDNIPNIAENYFYFRHSISLAFLPPGTKGSLTDGTSPSAHDLISQIQQERLVLRRSDSHRLAPCSRPQAEVSCIAQSLPLVVPLPESNPVPAEPKPADFFMHI